MKRAAILALALLAACSDAAPPDGNLAATPVDVNAPAIGSNEGAMAEAPSNIADAPTAPEPAPIPAKFRGTWAETKALCADLDHHSRITISGRTIRHPDFVMVGESVTASDDQFALEGHFEGSDRPAEAQFFINDAGDELTDGGGGGAVRVRCG